MTLIYNYEPLTKRVERSDILQYRHATGRRSHIPRLLLWACFGLSVVTAALIIVSGLSFIGVELIDSGLAMILIILWFPILIPLSVLLGRKVRQLINEEKVVTALFSFSQANGMILRVNEYPGAYGGRLFNLGIDRKIVYSMTTKEGVEIGLYSYAVKREIYIDNDFSSTDGASIYHKRHYHWGYAHMRLPRRLPHMVLDAVRNNGAVGRISNLPEIPRSKQLNVLEGDFDKYFHLYVPSGYETDARYVFTPDVMQVFIDSAGRYDVEIVDDHLLFYTRAMLKPKDLTAVQPLLEAIEKVAPEIFKQAALYRDTRLETGSPDNVIAPQGTRLQ